MEPIRCKCGKILPDGYKYKKCEACQNKFIDKAKKVLFSVGPLAITLTASTIALLTKGKNSPNDKINS